jgi:PhoH-like ATPase
MSKKLFVLDTNVLLHDPRAIFKFDEHDVVLPIYVIEEVDNFKKEMNELGRNARHISRLLDELREEAETNLQAGVTLPSGGRLRVSVPGTGLMDLSGNADHKIIQVALIEKGSHPDRLTVMVSMDSNLRIRSDALGLKAENYDAAQIESDTLYSGFQTLVVPAAMVDMLGKRRPIEMAEEAIIGLHPNSGVVLTDETNSKHTTLGRYDAASKSIVPLRVPREGCLGIRPRNLEQTFALDLLLDDKIKLVTLVGRAGTGKTLLAVAAGLRKVITEGVHARLLVSRPVFPLGRDVGYLPGTIEEKLSPWMQPIFDNLEYIFAAGGGRSEAGRSYEELVAAGTIQVEPLTYIRGRTLPHQFLIVDEAQNLTPHEVKTIVTRCGAETKIVLTGDPDQIDNPYVDSTSNGLATVAERFKNEMIAAHVTLTRGERSELAERASQLL